MHEEPHLNFLRQRSQPQMHEETRLNYPRRG